jgi:hypothetical protein
MGHTSPASSATSATTRVLGWDPSTSPTTRTRRTGTARSRQGRDGARAPRKAYAWAREAAPSQPITSGVWRPEGVHRRALEMDRFQLTESDVISFHAYVSRPIEERPGWSPRPPIFSPIPAVPRQYLRGILPLLKRQGAAYNWGSSPARPRPSTPGTPGPNIRTVNPTSGSTTSSAPTAAPTIRLKSSLSAGSPADRHPEARRIWRGRGTPPPERNAAPHLVARRSATVRLTSMSAAVAATGLRQPSLPGLDWDRNRHSDRLAIPRPSRVRPPANMKMRGAQTNCGQAN